MLQTLSTAALGNSVAAIVPIIEGYYYSASVAPVAALVSTLASRLLPFGYSQPQLEGRSILPFARRCIGASALAARPPKVAICYKESMNTGAT